MPKKATSLLLDEASREDLRWLAGYLRISQAGVIAMAIADMARRTRAEAARLEPQAPPRKRR